MFYKKRYQIWRKSISFQTWSIKQSFEHLRVILGTADDDNAKTGNVTIETDNVNNDTGDGMTPEMLKVKVS